ncbi:MAG: hypothetical protein VX474_02700 [Pseudomonadota bacterium]|nr:hypothetical protein [Pseudomonadota bacterium]MEE2748857.1 hypothetical protein [Pseudomonadota bacterium]
MCTDCRITDAKAAEQAELQRLTEEFLSKGGEIKEVPSTVMKLQGKKTKPIKRVVFSPKANQHK